MSKEKIDTPKETPKKRKPFESKLDEKTLREMILAGKTAEEIQQSLSIVSKQSLRQHVLKLITMDRKVYEVPGLYVRNLKRPMINLKGELKLSKNMLEFPEGTFKYGDQFELEVTSERITLTRITSPE